MDRRERIGRVIRAALAMQRASWEQGVLAQAFLELGETALAVLCARDAVANRFSDGRLGLKYDRKPVTDPAANGEPVLYAARITGDPLLGKAAAAMLEYLLAAAPRNADGLIYHFTDERWIWVDSLYMAPPFLAAAGHPREAVRQIEGYRKLLWNAEEKLFSHQWDDGSGTFQRKAFWGVGNGWAAAGMTRVLEALPGAMQEERRMLTGWIRDVLDGCLSRIRSDSLFHDVVDDESTFVETNLAQMLCSTIYRGVRDGRLDRRYLMPADAMRNAVYARVDADGLVRGVCGAPLFESPGTAPEGQAFFLLMEAAFDAFLAGEHAGR